MKEKLKSIFEANPLQDELHHTSDGICFFDKSACATHSLTLEDKTIITVSRADAMKEETLAEELNRIRLRCEKIMEPFLPFREEYERLLARGKEIAAILEEEEAEEAAAAKVKADKEAEEAAKAAEAATKAAEEAAAAKAAEEAAAAKKNGKK